MAALSGHAAGERGSTLIELLAATAIMGIAVVAILVGSTTTFTSSAQNRDQTTAGIVARNYAEALSVAVTSSNWCQPPAADPYGVTYTAPPNYSVTAAYGPCPLPAQPQFQTVTISVTSPSNGHETLITVVRQP